MTGTDLPLSCQVGECRNLATRTVTLELPTSWTESREYAVRTLQVAACDGCGHDLEADAKALLAARVQYARRLEMAEAADRQAMQIEAIGPPFEPVQGSIFAGWLSRLDKPTAQAAWRLLAVVKRQAMGRKQTGSGRRVDSDLPAVRGRRDRTASRPLSIETARFRRRIVVPPMDPGPPSPPVPPIQPSPRGGDDAA